VPVTTRRLVLEHSLNLLLHPACLAAMLLLPLTITTLIAAARRSGTSALWLLLCILVGAAFFFLPFFLWGLEVLPSYNQAAWLGGLLGLLPGVTYFLSLRKTG